MSDETEQDALAMCHACKGSGEGREDDETGRTACVMCNGSGEVSNVPDCEACGMPLDFDSPDCSHACGDSDLALPFAENH